jgi:hypothetical protein
LPAAGSVAENFAPLHIFGQKLYKALGFTANPAKHSANLCSKKMLERRIRQQNRLNGKTG